MSSSRLCVGAGLFCAGIVLLFAARATAAPQFHELDVSTATRQPRPDYPYEARRAKITGSGIVVLELSPAGEVTGVRMDPSTGSSLLDQAALNAFRRWQFRSGTPGPIRTPITFTMGGGVRTVLDVQARSMDDVLANFLGKGTVLHGPMPQYPRVPPWTQKRGAGVYELRVGPAGRVEDVKVLRTSGDATFDRITLDALGKWRLARGPLVIELPLSFTLTETKYSLDIPRRR